MASCVPGGAQPAQGWSGTVFHDDIIYVGSIGGKVMAVNPSTPSLEWSSTIAVPSGGGMSCGQTSALAAIYGTPAVDGDLVYVGSYSGKLYALNAATGAVRWDYPKEGDMGSIVASPLVANGVVYVCSSEDKESDNEKHSRVHALDTTYGEFRWKSDSLGEKLWTTPVVEGDVIYVSTFDGHVYTLSTETGNLLPWNFEAEVGFVSSPMLYEDTIFVGSFNHDLYAIKVGSDKPLWKFPGGNWFWATPVVKDGVVYAGCLDGKIYAIDAGTGEGLWKFNANDFVEKKEHIVASPVLVDDSLVVAGESGNVYVINPKTGIGERVRNLGTTTGEYTINAPVRASLCTHEGMVYIHAQDDWLYLVDIKQNRVDKFFSLASSP